ncbi:MAG: hypothetical protein GX896_07260 [Clostridiales bacterium]|nr:hypothetical protein [Clostridiales bacterium]
MYTCTKCGNILDGNGMCPSCGTAHTIPKSQPQYQQQQYQQQQYYQQPNNQMYDTKIATTGMLVLCFFIPLAGIILYAVEKAQNPTAAGKYLKIAIISIVLNIIFSILIAVVMPVLMVGSALY